MSTSEISLRNITKGDIEFVRRLRNLNRRSFFNTKLITKKAQQDWWNQYPYNPSEFFIICLDRQAIGTISEKWLINTPLNANDWVGLFEVGNLMLAKEYQGKGYMTEALRLLTKRGGFFVAHVKDKNTASLKVFERGKFWRTDSE